MIFHFGGHTFTRLEKSKIELLRNWRNADWIRPFMHYTEYITPHMQEQWFISINNSNNWYFIIEKDRVPIGCVFLRDIKKNDKVSAEPGIIMASADETLMVSVGTSMLFQGLIGFQLFGLKSFVSHQYKKHSRSLSNQFHLGSNITGNYGEDSVFAEGTCERFEVKGKKIRHALQTVTGEDHRKVKIIISPNDDIELIEFLTSRIQALPRPYTSQFQIEY